MQVNSGKKNTPYQRIWNSKMGKTVRKNKVLTGVGVAGATIVVAGGAFQSDAFASVARNGIVPAVGAGIATLGATAVHDAVVNDWGDSKPKAALKMALGTTATLGGAQMVGLAYDIPVLEEALTGTLRKAGENGDVLAGAGLIYAGAKAGQFAYNSASDALNEEGGKLKNSAKAIGATAGGAASLLGGAELIGRRFDIPVAKKALTGTVEFLANSNFAIGAGGAALAGGALVSAGQAAKNIKEGGNEFASAALGIGAVAGGLGGVEMMGRAAGIEGAKNLFIDNAHLVGGAAVTSTGVAWGKNVAGRIMEHGLSGRRGLELAAAAAAVPGGLAMAAMNAGGNLSQNLIKGSETAFGLGLGVAAVGFGKQAVDSVKEGKPEAAIFHGAMAAGTAIGGLYSVGDALEIPALKQVGEKIGEVTVEPLVEHVLAPMAEFLFENPILGGVIVAAGVGAVLYYRSQGETK